MSKYEKVEIKEIENGFIVEHINPLGDSWSDKIEMFIDSIEDVGVYIKVFYADMKKNNLKETDDNLYKE